MGPETSSIGEDFIWYIISQKSAIERVSRIANEALLVITPSTHEIGNPHTAPPQAPGLNIKYRRPSICVIRAHGDTQIYSNFQVFSHSAYAMASRPVIEYYFSFISLWSYIGSQRLKTLAQQHNAEIIYKPVDLLHIFSVSGGLPVKQRAPQRQAYRLLEMERWRKIREIPLVKFPKFYPADPSLAHRVLLAAIEEDGYDSDAVQEFARKGLETVWANEGDIADPDTIRRVADAAGLDGARLLKRAESEDGLVTKEKALTKEAEAERYFGAPVYVYKGEPFWGQDRIEMLEDVIKTGRDPVLLPKID